MARAASVARSCQATGAQDVRAEIASPTGINTDWKGYLSANSERCLMWSRDGTDSPVVQWFRAISRVGSDAQTMCRCRGAQKVRARQLGRERSDRRPLAGPLRRG